MKFIQVIQPFHIDERGEMSYILSGKEKIISVLLITSKKGSVRANHYHKKDTHYCYLLKGRMEYTYQDLKNKKSKTKTIIVEKGEVVHTPPMTLHAMKFLENSEFLALTTEERNKKKYEKDTVRTKLI